MVRQQLPPQIKKVELAKKVRGKPVVRYQLTVDVGTDPVTGKRKQFRKRYATEAEARDKLSNILTDVSRGVHVHDQETTVAQVVDDWLASKHALKPSTAHGYRVVLGPVVAELGARPVQKLTRRDLDTLIVQLRAGGLPGVEREKRKPWKPRTVNYMLTVLGAALEDQVKQGTLVRNVARLVDKLPEESVEFDTWTEAEVEQFLEHTKDDLYSLAWLLALSGLRRGEVSGLRWEDIDLDAKTLTVATSRVSFAKTISEGGPKSRRSRRTLPLHDDLVAAFRAAKKRQAEDRLLRGGAWADTGYVVVDRVRGGGPGGQSPDPEHAHLLVEAVGAGGRRAADPAARRPAYLRDVDASAGRADRRDRGVAWARVRRVHHVDVHALAGSGAAGGREFVTGRDNP
jgi:integrase